jgi:hypothetical protein
MLTFNNVRIRVKRSLDGGKQNILTPHVQIMARDLKRFDGLRLRWLHND